VFIIVVEVKLFIITILLIVIQELALNVLLLVHQIAPVLPLLVPEVLVQMVAGEAVVVLKIALFLLF
jgi:hypothetical protein